MISLGRFQKAVLLRLGSSGVFGAIVEASDTFMKCPFSRRLGKKNKHLSFPLKQM